MAGLLQTHHFNVRARRITVLVVATVLLVAALTPASPTAAQPVTIRTASGATPGVISPLLFRKPDLLKHYGKSYVLDWTHFRGTAPRVQALAAKQLDFGVLSYTSMVAAINNAKLDIKIVCDVATDGHPGYISTLWGVHGDSAIRGPADLRGKIVAVNVIGGGIDMALRVHLRKFGLEAKRDYNVVEVRFPAMEAFLREKKVQAAYFLPSFWYRAQAKGGVRKLFTVAEAIGENQLLFGVMRTEFLKQHRAVVSDFFEDYLYALRWFLDPAHRDEALQITAKYSKRPVKSFAKWAFTTAGWYRNANGIPNVKVLQANIDLLVREGYAKKGISVPDHTDLSFIEEANRRLKNR